MTQEELNKILENHRHWLNEDCDGWEGMRADLRGADLRGADLYEANLHRANLRGADLRGADLGEANLSGANLSEANLYEANLSRANLYGANLSRAYLYGSNLSRANLSRANLYEANLYEANLHRANLYEANLYEANLRGADLRGAKGNLIEYRKGKVLTDKIIGYKKCEKDVIVTLEIPRGAIVFSISGSKCRTNKAKVIAIDGTDRAISTYKYMSYYVGDEFTVYNFNCEYSEECAQGIHFFMTREEAENYR